MLSGRHGSASTIGPIGRPVEDEIRAVVNQRGAASRGRAGERLDRERIARQRRLSGVLRRLDVVVGRAVDDDVRPAVASSTSSTAAASARSSSARVNGDDIAASPKSRNDCRPELAGSAGHHHPRHARERSALAEQCATTVSCCAAVSSP